MARLKEELSGLGPVRPRISSFVREVSWTITLRPEHAPWVQTRSDLFSCQATKTVPPVNGCGKQRANSVISMVVMEVTSESFELHNSRRNNYLKQALYKDSSMRG